MTNLKKIVQDATRMVIENKLTLLRVSIVPITLAVLLGWLGLHITESYQVFLYNIADAVIWALLAIAVHRVILLGPTATGLLGNLRFTKREVLYVAYGFLIGLLITPIVFISAFFTIVGVIIGVIVGVIVWSRLSIVLPAIALDKDIGIGKAWHLTSGFTLTCLGSVVIIPVITVLPAYLLMTYSLGLLETVLSTVYIMLVMIYNIALLSITYKHLAVLDDPEEKRVDL